jgi:hypothetical protein
MSISHPEFRTAGYRRRVPPRLRAKLLGRHRGTQEHTCRNCRQPQQRDQRCSYRSNETEKLGESVSGGEYQAHIRPLIGAPFANREAQAARIWPK